MSNSRPRGKAKPVLIKQNILQLLGRLRLVAMALLAGWVILTSSMQTQAKQSQTSVEPVAGEHVTSGEATARVVPRRIFISGHSLTNQPIPSDLAAIAASLGTPLDWNRQYLEGSSIRERSRGEGTQAPQWKGYARGLDSANATIDVLAELRRPTKHPETPYDTLLITEQHGVLGSLDWNDTVRYLRHFHDRFMMRNSAGVTYFYEPWLSLDDKSDVRRWISYERAAAPVWQCIVERINLSLQAEGRPDRIRPLPASLALAKLIERATQSDGIPGVTQATVRETVGKLVADDVHLTPLGNYYMALVIFGHMFQRSPEGAWHPNDVTPAQASALQAVAAAAIAEPRAPAMSLLECRDYVLKSFLWTYLGYENSVHWYKEKGFFGSLFLRAKLGLRWWRMFSSAGSENPFADPAQTATGYWYPAP